MELRDLSDKQKALIDAKDRAQFGKAAQTYAEAEAGACVKLEKELHNQYIGFLNRKGFNMKQVLHAPMNRKSHLPIGYPDFTVMRGGKVLFIEFKTKDYETNEEQQQWIVDARRDGFEVLVLRSYASAISATMEFFNL